ncbi:hypothetical protein GCM10011399_38390 [Subtercola lobariae]|uniref:Mutator family transposase n=1 Tax=Subtercola lobariae TaxID=1588641 RepID=A0A917F164_9MICO|nr:hypothetical protein GCM10011399_38390 [Subtercola lobariae]
MRSYKIQFELERVSQRATSRLVVPLEWLSSAVVVRVVDMGAVTAILRGNSYIPLEGINTMTAPHIVEPAGLLSEASGDASADLIRSLLQTMTSAFLSAEADAVVGAEWGKPSPHRTAQRNGYRHLDLDTDTRVGTIEVAVPKLRQGTYFPEWLLERRKRAEAAMITVISVGSRDRGCPRAYARAGEAGASHVAEPLTKPWGPGRCLRKRSQPHPRRAQLTNGQLNTNQPR